MTIDLLDGFPGFGQETVVIPFSQLGEEGQALAFAGAMNTIPTGVVFSGEEIPDCLIYWPTYESDEGINGFVY